MLQNGIEFIIYSRSYV